MQAEPGAEDVDPSFALAGSGGCSRLNAQAQGTAGDTTVANLLARLQSDSAPQTDPLASCTKCSVTEGDLKVARAHCALLSWQLHDATKPLPSSLVEYQFQSITGEAMTTAHWDEFKKMLPETLREK